MRVREAEMSVPAKLDPRRNDRKEVERGMNGNVLMRVGLVLLALVVGFTAQAWAACPAGSTPVTTMDPDGDGNNGIQTPGLYCIPQTGFNPTANFPIDASNVEIFGETPNATVTVDGANQWFTVNGGVSNVTIRDLTINLTGATNNLVGVDTGGTVNGLTVSGVRFHNAGSTANNTAFIRIKNASNNVQILNNRFDFLAAVAANNNFPAILISAAVTGLQVQANEVNGVASAGAANDGVNSTAALTNANISDNTWNSMGGDCVDASGGSFTNSVLNNNICNANGNGFHLGTANNTQVKGNRINVTNGTGIIDTGGSNNEYGGSGNTITAGNDGIRFQSSNTSVRDNEITANTGDGIDVENNATNGVIEGNTILGAGDTGIELSHSSNTNFTIRNNSISNAGDGIQADVAGNHVIEGNTITNVSAGHGIDVTGGTGNNQIRNNLINGVSGSGNWGIAVTSQNNQITGNTVMNVSQGGGIHVRGANNVVENNTIDPIAQDGILVESSNNQIRNNTIDRAGTTSTATNQYAGIRLLGNADNNVVENNTITNGGSASVCLGIELVQTSSLTPDNNQIRGNSIHSFNQLCSQIAVGIRTVAGQNNTIENNEIRNSGNLKIGIQTRTTNAVTVRNNTVEGMTEAGIQLHGGTPSNPSVVQGNRLTNNVVGIKIISGAATIDSCNIIDGGATGVLVDSSANAAQFTFTGNTVINAAVLVRNNGVGQFNATGNYWQPAPQSGVNVFGNVDTSGALANDACGAVTPPPSPRADLGVSVAPAAPTVNAGDSTSATVTVSNAGPDAANNVQLTIDVTGGATGVSTTTPGCTASGTTVTCTIPTLGAGANFTATVNFTAPGAAGTVTVNANATSATTDPNAANNSASASITVQRPTVGADVTTLVNRKIATGRFCLAIAVLRNAPGGATGDVTITAVNLTGSGWTGSAQVVRGPGQLLRDGGVAVVLVRDLGCTATNPADLELELQFSDGTVMTADLDGARRPATAVRPLSVALRGGLLAVQAQGAERVKAEVFALNGKKLFEAEGVGGRLVALAAAQGRPLANGVYLVAVTVEKADGTVHREIRKVVVVR